MVGHHEMEPGLFGNQELRIMYVITRQGRMQRYPICSVRQLVEGGNQGVRFQADGAWFRMGPAPSFFFTTPTPNGEYDTRGLFSSGD